MKGRDVTGYSGKPLWQKLGLKPGMRCVVMGAVEDYRAMLGAEVPEVAWTNDPRGVECVHVFVTKRKDLDEALKRLRSEIAINGMVWVSWPKRSSGVFSEVTEDTIRELALPLGWVDVKVCSVNAVWSGLKLVIRKELRQAR